MKILNSAEVDAWLFEHAQVQGHVCSSIKTWTPQGDSRNGAWEDQTTLESIRVIYEDDVAIGEQK